MHDPKEVLEICNKATPGPWEVEKYHFEEPGYEQFIKQAAIVHWGNEETACTITRNNWSNPLMADLNFIALARTALPELAQRVIELEADNAKLRAVAEAAQELRRAWEDEVDRDTEAEFAGELIQALADAGYGR